MKINSLYLVLLSVLVFACKGKTDPQSNPTPNPTEAKAGAQVVLPTKPSTAKFLSLSDVHVDVDLPATTFGSSSISVTSNTLWDKTKAKIESVVTAEAPTFMVYLGDLPGYDDAERRENTHAMLENLRSLQIGIPILYLPGNNDSLEGDYHSFTNSNGNSVLTKDKDSLNPWPVINVDASKVKVSNLNFKKEFGYYSVDLTDNGNTLKVIALNTVIFSSKVAYNPTTGTPHPAYNSRQNTQHEYVMGDDGISQEQATQYQMTWFEKQLQSLKGTDRVMIIMHIPIGLDGYGGTPMWNTELTYKDLSGKVQPLHNGFVGLISKYASNITGLLNGHTHTDGLRRIYKTATPTAGQSNDPKDMVSFSVSTPGIAVNHGNNPAFKIFTYDTGTYDLLDFKTYFASPMNTAANGDFQFHQDSTYTFQEVYQVKNRETIFKTLAHKSDSEVVQYVNETLGTRSNQDVKLIHDSAVDVHKN
jgi:predicted MPP superfamily phosphohydrolase